MSKDPLAISDLDIDTMSFALVKTGEYDKQILDLQKQRDRVASIIPRTLSKVAEAAGVAIADYDVDFAQKVLKPKLRLGEQITTPA